MGNETEIRLNLLVVIMISLGTNRSHGVTTMKHVLLSTGSKQKPIAREIMILLVAITLGAAVETNALAAGTIGGGGGGGGHGGGGGLAGSGGGGGGHPGGGFGGGHMGGGFGGEHAGGSPMGGLGGTHLGGLGGTESHGTRFGGDHDGDRRLGGDHDGHHRFGGDHDGRHRFGGDFIGTYGYFPGYDYYSYDNFGDYANDGACFQYRHVHTAAGWRWRQVWVCN
jgi:hypothetical protein